MKRITNADKVQIVRKREKPSALKGPARSSQQTPYSLREGEKVSLLIGKETEIGYKAIINNRAEGILYKNEVFQPLKKGQRVEGFIRKIRDDKKIDVSLYKPGYKKVDALSERIIERLKSKGGFLPVTDKSAPETIAGLFGVSKKAYKMIIGRLYKNRLIDIEEDGIRMINKAQGTRRKAQGKIEDVFNFMDPAIKSQDDNESK